MIIFGSVRFLSKKVTKPNFFLKKNRNQTEIGSNRPISVRFGFLGQKLVWLGFFGFGSVFFRFWLGFFGFGSFFFWFFVGFGSVFRFFAYNTETEPNRTGRFFQKFNRFNRFFFSVIFFPVFSV